MCAFYMTDFSSFTALESVCGDKPHVREELVAEEMNFDYRM